MNWDFTMRAISEVGFPVFVACFLLWERFKFMGMMIVHQTQMIEHQAQGTEILKEIKHAIENMRS